MAPKSYKTIKLGKLAVGAVFQVINASTEREEFWKVIGRPSKSGENEDGRIAYWVPCGYVPKDKKDQGTPVPTKSFNLTSDVVFVRGGRKDSDAIDSRDQPHGVTPLEKLVGVPTELVKELKKQSGDTDLQTMIEEDEEVSDDV
jgi:hypothetical protein